MNIDSNLLKWATPTGREYIEALIETGSQREAAKKFGVHRSQIGRAIERARVRAAMHGYSPETLHHTPGGHIPDPYIIDRMTIQTGGDGTIERQWTKTKLDDQRRLELVQQIIADQVSDAKVPRLTPVEQRGSTIAELANLYVFTDYHMGMLAWHKEGGADWDLKIAEDMLVKVFSDMMARSPEAAVGIIGQLGDFLHFDGLQAITPTHGHPLDADSRFEKVVKATIRVLRRVIDMALAKHDQVFVILAEGNHDIASSVWLRQLFSAMYDDEDRVVIDDSPLPYYALKWGRTALFFHHGHLKKNQGLFEVFASQFSKIWGETVSRYAHTGHKHHTDIREQSGLLVWQHPTLAAPDAFAARGGWISKRQASCITYDKMHGMVGQTITTPGMVGYD